MAKPLKVDEMWLERIASLLNDMEFGSLQIVVHEGQIVQMERTERKRFENTASGAVKTSGSSGHPASSEERIQDDPTKAIMYRKIELPPDNVKCRLSSRHGKDTRGVDQVDQGTCFGNHAEVLFY